MSVKTRSRPPQEATTQKRRRVAAGDVALLSYAGEVAEAKGIAMLIKKLTRPGPKRIPPPEILVLLRGDHNGTFSKPIKQHLDRQEIPYSDPDAVKRLLAEPANRQMLEAFRLLVHRDDSLAWASLLQLTARIGDAFLAYIYHRARKRRTQFGTELLAAYEEGFAGGPSGSSRCAQVLVRSVLSWLEAQAMPPPEETRWGAWMIETAEGAIAPSPTEELQRLLLALDELVEPGQELGRYLGQIGPLGRDLAQAESDGVRIMTMAASKGLTVQAAIRVGLEEGIVPRPDQDLGEERRLLYVAMTRAKEVVYGTWARRRRGPTARAGRERVRELRQYSTFLQDGPVESQDGESFVQKQ